MLRGLYLILCMLLIVVLKAQHPYYYTINDDNGLPSNEVYDLAQDSFGFMWVGTNAGLYRYDGTDFTAYKNTAHTGKAVSHLHIDGKGKLWCQNFTGQIFSVSADTLKQEFDWSKRIKNFPMYCFDINDHIWISGDSGLYRAGKSTLNQHIGSTLLGSVPGSSVFADVSWYNNRLYFSEKKAIGYISDNRVTLLTNTDKPTRQKELSQVSSFHVEGNRLLLLTRTEKVNAVWEIRNDSVCWLTDLPAALGRVYSMHNDGAGKWWIGGSYGVLCLDYNLQPQYGGKLLFEGKGISKVLLDKEGNYWFSTVQDGIYVVPGTDVWIYTGSNSALADTRVKQLTRDEKGNLYIGYQNGQITQYHLQSGKATTITLPNIPTDVQAMEYNAARQQLLVGQNVTWMINTATMQPVQVKGISNVKAMAQVHGDTFLFGTVIASSLITIKPTIDTLVNYRSKRTRCLFANTTNRQWWLGHTDGLWLWANGQLTELSYRGHAISATDIVKTTNGMIWVSTLTDGVLGYSNGQPVVQLKDETGIRNGFVRKMAANGNTLWIATEDNLTVYDVLTKAKQHYSRFDGLPSNEISDIEFVNGKILLATPKGMVEIPEGFNPVNPVPPSIYISGVAVHERDTLLIEKYILGFSDNNIRISFKGIAFRSHGQFTYRYRMQGLDTSWISTNSQSNFARYPSLPPGSYVFEVKAVNEDGIESTGTARVYITALKPFWQQWWFYVLCGLVLVALVSGYFTWRIGMLRRKAEMEKRLANSQLSALKAQMNPHFMFNALNSIQDLVLQQDTTNAQLYLGKFSELTRAVLEASGSEFISLQKEMEMLQLYLDLEKLRFGNDMQYTLRVDEQIDTDEMKIPAMLVQPFVENALKHGLLHKQGIKQLDVEFDVKGEVLVCTIDDNGIGRKAADEINARKKKHRSFATDAANERLRLLHDYYNLNIDLQIIDKPDGTRVVLTIPVYESNNSR